MRKLSVITLVAFSSFFVGCESDGFDAAGTCIICTTGISPVVDIEACANGDGTITTVVDGGQGIESNNDLATFQLTQENAGATCN